MKLLGGGGGGGGDAIEVSPPSFHPTQETFQLLRIHFISFIENLDGNYGGSLR